MKKDYCNDCKSIRDFNKIVGCLTCWIKKGMPEGVAGKHE